MSYNNHGVRVGADIGGTFTDVVLEIGADQYSAKVLTNYREPEQAIIDGLIKVVEIAGIGIEHVDQLIHGTTLATNALIEQRGANTAFITSKGFRDVIEMRTEGRFEQYDLNLRLPPPLISREHRYVVDGRVAASGRELVPLDEAGLGEIAQRIRAGGYESVAVGFIHSYVNADHERRARDILARELPAIAISISSEVSPQMREFERFNTVCANAFVKPLMASYLGRLVDRFQAEGGNCPVFMMHSGGGLISVESAIEFPVRLLESGPAGGAIYAADFASRFGLDKVLSYDKKVVAAHRGKSAADLAGLDLDALNGVSAGDKQHLLEAFSIRSIDDLARNRFVRAARAIRSIACQQATNSNALRSSGIASSRWPRSM